MNNALTCGLRGLKRPQIKFPLIPLIMYIKQVRTVLEQNKTTSGVMVSSSPLKEVPMLQKLSKKQGHKNKTKKLALLILLP